MTLTGSANLNLGNKQLLEDSFSLETLQQAREATHILLTDFSAKGDFTTNIVFAFGKSFDTQVARLIAQNRVVLQEFFQTLASVL